MAWLAAEGGRVAARQFVGELESRVVTRARVLGARVAEPDDQLERLARPGVFAPQNAAARVACGARTANPAGRTRNFRCGRRRCRSFCGGYFLPPSFLAGAASFFS